MIRLQIVQFDEGYGAFMEPSAQKRPQNVVLTGKRRLSLTGQRGERLPSGRGPELTGQPFARWIIDRPNEFEGYSRRPEVRHRLRVARSWSSPRTPGR